MNRQSRRSELLKLATKKGLQGKHSRKDVEKKLEKAKTVYNDMRKKLEQAEKEVTRLESIIQETKGHVQTARSDMLKAHDILQTMDFSNASYVKVRKDDDVSYAIDGKWQHVDDDYASTPYSNWAKSKGKEVEETDDVLSTETEGILDNPEGQEFEV